MIEGIRAEHGYSIVFDVAESGVVAADTNLDITGAVLLQLGIDPNDPRWATESLSKPVD